MGCHFLLQEIFTTQWLNPGLPHCRQMLYHLSHQGRFSSVQFSPSVLSDSLRPHEWQHARPPCPSQTPRVYSNSCPSSRWCHSTISSSVVPFSSCPQSLPESGSFPMSQLFTWGGQSTGVSASASVSPVNTQDWSPLAWTGWISLQSKGLSRVFSNNTAQKHKFLVLSFLHSPTLTSIHDHGKNHSLDQTYLCWQISIVLFHMFHSSGIEVTTTFCWRRKWQPTPCLENPMDRGAWWAAVHGFTRVRHSWVTNPPPEHSGSLLIIVLYFILLCW